MIVPKALFPKTIILGGNPRPQEQEGGTGFGNRRYGEMDAIIADIFPQTQISYPVMFARFCGALFFGAVIGFEREARDKAAGLRTHMLISLAAALFAVISIESVHMPGLSDEQVQIDPLRVVEAVTAGVAFLAAGSIVLSKGQVRGLTTGAGMWLAGAIGLALGFGHWLIAAFAVIAGLAVLFLIGRIQKAWYSAEHKNDHPADIEQN